MAAQDHLLRLTNSTNTLGNSISLKMVEFLDHVKDQPLGFRDLGLDFLSICKILNSLQTSLQEHFRTGQPFPQQAIPELSKILDQTLHDFTQLQYLLEKFMEYEKGGTFAMLQKTWRQFFADKDISKVRNSLQTNKGALTMTMLLTNINTTSLPSPVGYEYGMLAAKLESPESTFAMLPPHSNSSSSQPPNYSHSPPSPSQAGSLVYSHTYQTPLPPPGLPLGWQGNPLPPQQPQPAQPVQRKPIPPPGPPAGFVTPTEPKVPQPPPGPPPHPVDVPVQKTPKPPAGPPPGFVAQTDPKVPQPLPGPLPHEVDVLVAKTPKPPAGPPPGFQVHTEPAPRTPKPPSGPPPPKTVTPDNITSSLSKMVVADIPTDPSKMPRRTPAQTVSTNVALVRSLVSAVSAGKHSIVEQLLNRGVSPNLEGDKIALVEAVAQNDLTSLKLLLEFGADPNIKPTNGFPALRYACEKGQEEAARLLLAYGADVKQPDVLEKAVYEKHIGIISILLDAGYPTAGMPDDYYRPLNTAVRDDLGEILELLISRGADPNLAGGQGIPLVMAADKPAMLKILLARGADVTKAAGALEKACYEGCIEAIHLLLDAGFPINGYPDDYYRPLQTAVRENKADVVALLLARGADPNHQGGQGISLQIAADNPEMLKQLIAGGADPHSGRGVLEKAVYCNNIESISILVEAGAPLDGHPEDYYRPLFTAVRDNLPQCMSKLLSLGADPNIIAGQGCPLLEAASQDDSTRLQIMLDAGADVNLAQRGVTALMLASEHNRVGNVELLLNKGANPNIVDGRGRTAMEIASEEGHDDLVMLLLDAVS